MTADERWLPVVGWEGLYEISDHGRVRSLLRGEPRLLSSWSQPTGHLRVKLGGRDTRKTYGVHQLVAQAFIGPRPVGLTCCRHLNGDPTDNRVENLAWGTASDNMHDAVRHGTHYEVRRTHCPRGHEYDEQNTLMNGGARTCRACARERMAGVRAGKVKPQHAVRAWARAHGFEVGDTGPIRREVREAYAAATAGQRAAA